jgi:F-type H+-transporting ATPase subunit b
VKSVLRMQSGMLGTAVLLGVLTLAPLPRLHAQTSPATPRTHDPSEEHMDAPENNAEIEQYRHSSVVQAIARTAHVSTETAAEIFEDFNSAVLIFAILWFLAKMLPKMFRQRSETIQKELVEARTATEEANRRLAEVEAKLLRLDSEIEAMRLQMEKDAEGDEKRVHVTLEAERERIIASAEQEIAAVQAGAQRELKKFAADLAIDQAMHRIRLTAETDKALVREFGAKLISGGKA